MIKENPNWTDIATNKRYSLYANYDSQGCNYPDRILSGDNFSKLDQKLKILREDEELAKNPHRFDAVLGGELSGENNRQPKPTDVVKGGGDD